MSTGHPHSPPASHFDLASRLRGESESPDTFAALLSDAIHAKSWSPTSKIAWRRIFAEAANETRYKRHREKAIARDLNRIGALLNRTVGSGRVGMAMKKSTDCTSFHMMLSIDEDALKRNRLNLMLGIDSPAVTEVGKLIDARPS